MLFIPFEKIKHDSDHGHQYYKQNQMCWKNNTSKFENTELPLKMCFTYNFDPRHKKSWVCEKDVPLTKTTFFQSFDVKSQQLNHFCLFSFRNVKRGTVGVGNPHLFFLCYLCLFLLYYCYCIFAYASYFMIWNGESTNPNSDKCSDNRVKSGVMWDLWSIG